MNFYQDLNDDDTDETLGGLRRDTTGQGDDSALFESTLFWHYGGGSCYGEDSWEDDVDAIVGEHVFTQEDFDELLSDLGITDLDAELEANEECQFTKDKEGGCMEYYEILEELKEKEETIVDPDAPEDPDDTGLESDGETPVIMEGAASDTGISAGPNFEVGRRTWTDVTDD